MTSHVFFKASKLALKQITEIYDFVWPTAVAIWNLKWQVSGYMSVRENATEAELIGRFAAGSNIHGANIRRASIDHSWEQQQEYFARFLLVNLIAVYEAWVEDVLEATGNNTKDVHNQIQFPTGGMLANPKSSTNRDPIKGVRNAIAIITRQNSQMLIDAFYPTLIQHKKNSKANLDSLLYCYRYFKECRNSLVHGGGVAKSSAELAYHDFLPHAINTKLSVSEVPEHYPIMKGANVKLSLRGVVGLSDIIQRMIVTLDAEISRAGSAEEELKRRWIEKHGTKRMLKQKDLEARKAQVGRMIKSAGFPQPLVITEMEKFISRNNLAF